jgi:excinuclease ABC subunit A
VDQNPIGKSTRSNPATYVKAYDAIRELFAEQPLARQMGFTSQYFSFNTDGGRCEVCKGAGVITVEMQFMADLTLECEACHGQRFKHDVLEVRFHEKNINDVLNMTVSEAIDFFGKYKEKAITDRLKLLRRWDWDTSNSDRTPLRFRRGEPTCKTGLFYQSGAGGADPFHLDEPTTGLHFHDIKRLLSAFDALLSEDIPSS